MTDALESELDLLFQLPPAEMVEARNALAARLKKAGDRNGSARVKGLKRPAPAAWAINQVFFRERALLEDARAQVANVRALQATDSVDRAQLSAAGEAQRASLQAIVDAALRYCAQAGLPTGPLPERRVFTTVQAWLGGNGAETPGRMTRELEPSGFEAIGLLGAPAPLPAATASAAARPAPTSATAAVKPVATVKPAAAAASKPPGTLRSVPPAAESAQEQARRARERLEARVIEHKQFVQWAQERVVEQRKKQALAEHEVGRAQLEVADAERALAQRRSRLAEREAELARKRSEVEDAQRAQRSAEDALAQARADLSKH